MLFCLVVVGHCCTCICVFLLLLFLWKCWLEVGSNPLAQSRGKLFVQLVFLVGRERGEGSGRLGCGKVGPCPKLGNRNSFSNRKTWGKIATDQFLACAAPSPPLHLSLVLVRGRLVSPLSQVWKGLLDSPAHP